MRRGRLVRWGPFAVAMILSAIVMIDRSGADGVATFVGELFLLLPVAAMIAVGGTRTRRGAAYLGLVATAMMVALDFAPLAGPGAAGPQEQLAVGQDRVLVSGGPENEWLSPGAFGRAARDFPEALFLRGGRDQTHTLDAPVFRSSLTLLKLAYFLVPFGLIGWTLGIEGWIRRRVVFPKPSDEFLARLVLDIGTAVFVIWLALATASRSIVSIVLGGNQVWTVAVPFVFVLIAGAPGWLRARGDSRTAPTV